MAELDPFRPGRIRHITPRWVRRCIPSFIHPRRDHGWLASSACACRRRWYLLRVWVDGSFLSQRIDPLDVDIVALINAAFAETPAQTALLEWLTSRENEPRRLYRCDTYEAVIRVTTEVQPAMEKKQISHFLETEALHHRHRRRDKNAVMGILERGGKVRTTVIWGRPACGSAMRSTRNRSSR